MKSLQRKVAVSLCLSPLMLLCAVVPAFSLENTGTGTKSDLLLPPIAPKYDFSANKPSNSSSNSNSSSSNANGSNHSSYNSGNSGSSYGSSSRDADQEPPNAMNDAGKIALQQATTLYQQGKTDQAEAAFRHVLTLNVRCVDAYYNLGVIAETRGDFQSALNNYQVASRLNPDDAELHDAVTAVQGKISQKAASDPRNHSQQQQAQDLSRPQPNREGLKQAAADAQAAYKAGNFDKAVNNLNWVASQAPNDPDVQYALSQAYKGKGDQQNARAALSRALSLDPSNRLYQTAMSQLNSRGGAPVNSGSGYGAPPGSGGSHSYTDDTANNSSRQGKSVPYTPYNAPFSSAASQTGWQSASADDAPTGQITPFTSQGESSLPGGGVHHGGVAGSGSSGFFAGTGGNGYGTKTRLTRAAVGAGAGMAMGAIFSGGSHHMGRSMMAGGLIGGALGLFSGGW
jgi:tetratricopeptide (TPR) repeat protein